MSPRPSSARCSNPGTRGFTLSELLLGLTLASLVVFGVGTGYVFVTRAWMDHQARAQAQQSLRSAVAAISRELRIAGACMGVPATQTPLATNFKALAGTSGPPDTLILTTNPRCAGPTALTAPYSGGTTIQVADTLNYQTGMWGFIGDGNTADAGEYFLITGITAGAPGALVISAPLTGTYPQTTQSVQSFVAGADRRTFAVSSSCTGCNGIPTLTLQSLGVGASQPLVKGIDTMTLGYVLNRKWSDAPSQCVSQTGGTNSLCIVTLPELSPSITGDWRLVRAITMTLGARSLIPIRASGSADGYYHLSESLVISPRNFVFTVTPRVPWTPY
jgi:type II secretory pathway pseudopilin PulG